MDPTDAALIKRCRRGDGAAWEALVHRYQRLVYAIPRRAGLDEQAAADVFQTVFTRLLEQIDRIERPDRIAAWLVTTARREAWRVGRNHAARRALVPRDSGEDAALSSVAAEDPLPDEILAKLEEQHTVRRGLEALDERCRTLLTLLFYRDGPLSYATAAARLGVPEGSIGPTRARCLEKLRRLLHPFING